jgi:cytochrome c6
MMTKKWIVTMLIVGCICCTAFYAFAEKASPNSGAALFAANCKVCHPDGGNIINPAKTLHKKDRMANHVTTEADIISRMRNPGPGMTKFDEKTISEKDAHEIAEYVMKTFNK